MGMLTLKQLELSPLPDVRAQRVGLLHRVRPLESWIALPTEPLCHSGSLLSTGLP